MKTLWETKVDVTIDKSKMSIKKMSWHEDTGLHPYYAFQLFKNSDGSFPQNFFLI